jgi:hypothetical protein
MTKHSLMVRKVFWDNVVLSVQIFLGSFQAITMFAKDNHMEGLQIDPEFNWIAGVIQAALGVIAIWTKDANNDGIIDMAQLPEVPTVTEITTRVESTGPAKITVEKDVKLKDEE